MKKLLFLFSVSSIYPMQNPIEGGLCGPQDVVQFDTLESHYKKKLLEKFDINSHVSHYDSDLNKVLVITNWVSNLWQHNGNNVPKNSDAISMLDEVLGQRQQFRCVEYSIVLHACLNALDIPTRIVRLKTADCETREQGVGHIICEAYIGQLKKWVMIDPQENIVPFAAGIPMSALELQKVFDEPNSKLQFVSIEGPIDNDNAKIYQTFITPYLYYFQTDLENSYYHIPDQKSLMLAPKGARTPTVFQNKYPLLNVVYSDCRERFYAKPAISMH